MAGAIDLFAGSSPIAGSNLWDVNKNPLNQLNQGIDDVIGKQAGSAGSQTTQALQSLINTIVGKGLDFLTTTGPEALLSDVDQFFTNLLKFLGELDPLSSSFDVAAAAQTFLNTILIPTNLIAPLVEDASNIISGVTGFVPMANLDTALLTAVIGGAQALIDAILETVGIPAGSGTETQVNQYFSDLLNMLANPSLTSGGFDPAAAVATFINDTPPNCWPRSTRSPSSSTTGRCRRSRSVPSARSCPTCSRTPASAAPPPSRTTRTGLGRRGSPI